MGIFKGQNTLLNGLVSYWSFNGNANDNWQNYDGSIDGATLQVDGGILNDCYYFDGVDDAIRFGTSSDFADDTDFSISIWFKPDTTFGNTDQRFLFKNNASPNRSWALIYNRADGLNKMQVWHSTTGSNLIKTNSNFNYNENRWIHIVLVFNISNSVIKLYKDGELDISINESSSINTNNVLLSLGAATSLYPTIANEFKGYLDEFGYWNRAISETEINKLYNQGRGITFNNLSYIPKFARSNLQQDIFAYWKFDETSGDLIDYINIYDGNTSDITYNNIGIIKNGYYFNGSDSFIRPDNINDLAIGTENYSISLWFKTNNSGVNQTLIFSCNNSISNWFFIRLQPDSTILFQVDDGINPLASIQSSNTFTDNRWHQAVLTYLASSYEWRLYIDGILIGIDTNINSSIDNDYEFLIGATYDLSLGDNVRYVLNGNLDEIGIWKQKILSHEEIKILYNYNKATPLNKFKQAPKKIGYSLLNGLISYWSFDENVNDLHRSNDGSVNGATHTNGFYDKGYYYDGTDDYITGNAFLNNETKGSISCWFKTDNITSNGVLFYHGDSVVGSTNAYVFLYVRSSTGDISFRLRRNGGFGYEQATTNSFNDNEWHHVVITYDGNGVKGSWKCYVDNTLENFPVVDDDESIGWFKNSSDSQVHTEYRFGSWNRSSGDGIFFKGYMDEFGVWNRVLNEQEISLLYNNGQGLKYSNFRY